MKLLTTICIASIAFFGCTAQPEAHHEQTVKEWPLIIRKGDKLYEGEKEFRFMSFAAPNIQQNESQIREDRTNRFPDEYEIRDILDGLNRVGGRATRMFSLSLYHPDDKEMPVYIPARRTYNETAFECLDRVIALCHEYDVRLIIPFIASQSFGGIRGVDEFSALAGKPQGAFWTDPEQKEDFKHLIDFVLNRKNTVNGIVYKEDPAILAWQLGNEFGSYAGDRGLSYQEWTPRIEEWCLEMSAYLKKQDPNHLIIESGGCGRQTMLDDPNIDIISEHLYEYWNRMGGRDWNLAPIARNAYEECKDKKPIIVDEFGLGTTENLRELMQTIRETGIVGGLMWSIRGHRRDGGWYYHNEGGTFVNSFHVPGFAAGTAYEERRLIDLIRAEAHLIDNREITPARIPAPAPILMTQNGGLTWRGATGAANYTIERSETEAGPWQVIAVGIDDSVIADVTAFEHTPEASDPLALFYDELRKKNTIYYYRIKGENKAGSSEYSNIISM